MMKKNTFAAFLLLLSACFCAAAGNPVTSFVDSVKGRYVTVGYSFVYRDGDIPVSGSGTLSFQDKAFSLSGNGMRIICDGSTRWTLDEEAKECYIETLDSLSPDYEQNPALMLMALDKAFSAPSAAKSSSLAGRSTSAVSLTPLAEDSRMGRVTAHFLGEGSLYALVIDLKGGATLTLTLKELKKEKPGSISPAFTLDISSLDSSYVVTDLR